MKHLVKHVAVLTVIVVSCVSVSGVIVEKETGSPQVILEEEYWLHPKGNVCKFANGDVVVRGRFMSKRSLDNGLTWADDGSLFLRYPFISPNGGAMHFYGAVIETSVPGRYLTTFVHTVDNSFTQDILPAVLDVGGEWSLIAGTHSRIIQLSDGTLLHCRYGIRNPDTKPRIFVARSEDGGSNWEYVTTIAHSEALWQGYSEPELLLLPDGDILCFIRSGSDIGDNLYVSRSSDDGQTWSSLETVADRGVAPQAIQMHNGIIVVSYGRPGNWLAFSTDNGYTWTGHYEYYTGPIPYDNANYSSLVEVEPGRILVVYTRTDPLDNTLSEVVGTFFTVQRVANISDVDFDGSGQIDVGDLEIFAEQWLTSAGMF